MDCKEALALAKAKLEEQNEILQQLEDQPMAVGTIVGDVKAGRVMVAAPGGVSEVKAPAKGKVKPGTTVLLAGGGIFRVLEDDAEFGQLTDVVRVLSDGVAEIAAGGGARAVSFEGKVKAGDRVLLDAMGLTIVRNFGQPEIKAPLVSTGVSWSDIGGQVAAKQALVDAIELPVKHPAVFKRYGETPGKGVLLYGPPGCGKTMLGKAAATALSEIHGGNASANGFIYVKGPEILNMYVGESEAIIRRLFEAARRHKAAHGYPAILFIDEADAVLGKRGARGSMGMESTTVPMFLTEMDGLDENAAFVLLATNRPDVLDPAVVRDGRIDRKVEVVRPDQMLAEDIFAIYLRDKPIAGATAAQLAGLAAENMFNPARTVLVAEARGGDRHPIRLGDVASGAMIAGVVKRASLAAMRREISSGKKGGITADDIGAALDATMSECSGLNMADDVAALGERIGEPIVRVGRAAA